MARQNALFNPGVSAALGAAPLFGASTPVAKHLLNDVGPWLLAGLFYLGSGIGLTIFRLIRRTEPVRLERSEAIWLIGATLTGGVAGTVSMPGSCASV